MRCDIYLDAVEFRTQAWLFELRSPKGTPLTEVFQQELGLDSVSRRAFWSTGRCSERRGPLCQRQV